MELSDNQLAAIRVYVSRECKYPDLQIEITDHIKYRIQDLLTADNDLILEDAFAMVRTEFGDDDFKVFLDNRKASLKNKYNNLFIKSLLGYLKPKYVFVSAILVLWVYLFYVDVRPPEMHGLLGMWTGFLPFLPMYVIGFSRFFNPARHYKEYYIFVVSNTVLSKCTSIVLLFYILNFVGGIYKVKGNAAIAGSISAVTLIAAIVVFRAGYMVRKATINDCREIESRYKPETI